METLNEFQKKLKEAEHKFKMIELVLDARNISDKEKKELNLEEVLKKNQKLNFDDFDINQNELPNIDLVKMLNTNYEDKKKIFTLKK